MESSNDKILMRKLFPAIRPYQTHSLSVDTIHNLYIEECGNPSGIPIVFIHGGPGGGTRTSDRCFFDPEKYRIILFDQRGCGKSTPHAELKNNNTKNLLSDIEAIRQMLRIEQWAVFGGSWGSTLSLVYAQHYPNRVKALILRGIFLCREHDISWFYQDGVANIYPDYWEDYVSIIPENERGDILTSFHKRLTGTNEIEQMAAAKAWSLLEGRCATLKPNKDFASQFEAPHMALSMARIEAHYFVNNAFLKPNEIENNIPKIRHIPCTIVHGRYDMVCPIYQAFDLYKAWPEAIFKIVSDAGHSSSEPGIIHELIEATERLAISIGKE